MPIWRIATASLLLTIALIQWGTTSGDDGLRVLKRTVVSSEVEGVRERCSKGRCWLVVRLVGGESVSISRSSIGDGAYQQVQALIADRRAFRLEATAGYVAPGIARVWYAIRGVEWAVADIESAGVVLFDGIAARAQRVALHERTIRDARVLAVIGILVFPWFAVLSGIRRMAGGRHPNR